MAYLCHENPISFILGHSVNICHAVSITRYYIIACMVPTRLPHSLSKQIYVNSQLPLIDNKDQNHVSRKPLSSDVHIVLVKSSVCTAVVV